MDGNDEPKMDGNDEPKMDGNDEPKIDGNDEPKVDGDDEPATSYSSVNLDLTEPLIFSGVPVATGDSEARELLTLSLLSVSRCSEQTKRIASVDFISDALGEFAREVGTFGFEKAAIKVAGIVMGISYDAVAAMSNTADDAAKLKVWKTWLFAGLNKHRKKLPFISRSIIERCITSVVTKIGRSLVAVKPDSLAEVAATVRLTLETVGDTIASTSNYWKDNISEDIVDQIQAIAWRVKKSMDL